MYFWKGTQEYQVWEGRTSDGWEVKTITTVLLSHTVAPPKQQPLGLLQVVVSSSVFLLWNRREEREMRPAGLCRCTGSHQWDSSPRTAVARWNFSLDPTTCLLLCHPRYYGPFNSLNTHQCALPTGTCAAFWGTVSLVRGHKENKSSRWPPHVTQSFSWTYWQSKMVRILINVIRERRKLLHKINGDLELAMAPGLKQGLPDTHV